MELEKNNSLFTDLTDDEVTALNGGYRCIIRRTYACVWRRTWFGIRRVCAYRIQRVCY